MPLPLDPEDHPILCTGCGQPALARCKTDAGRREVLISKLCEPCFFEWCGVPDDHLPDDDEDGDEDDEDDDEATSYTTPVRIPQRFETIN